MLVFFGWGKKSKKIADAGIMKCKNCNNYSAFEVRELFKNVNIYFIPVAKWRRKTFLVCNVCEAGYELTKQGREEILQRLTKIPDNKTSIAIYNRINTLTEEYLKEKNNPNEWEGCVVKELTKEGFKQDDINYVLPTYAGRLIDSSKQDDEVKK